MSSTTRLLIAIVVILFLLASGILGGLQWFQSHSTSDPQKIQSIAEAILPIKTPKEFIPVKGADLSEISNLKIASFEKKDDRGRMTVLNMTTMSKENYDASKGFKEESDWKKENYYAVREDAPQLSFMGKEIYGYRAYLENTKTLDKKIVLGVALDWESSKVILLLNGPIETVNVKLLQDTLNSINKAHKN